MNPLIVKLNDKRLEAGLSTSQTSKIIGVSKTTLDGWIYKNIRPIKKSLKRVEKAILKIESGQHLVEEIEQQPSYLELPDTLTSDQKFMYELIQKIEVKYGQLSECPEDDEDLKKLRKRMLGEIKLKRKSKIKHTDEINSNDQIITELKIKKKKRRQTSDLKVNEYINNMTDEEYSEFLDDFQKVLDDILKE